MTLEQILKKLEDLEYDKPVVYGIDFKNCRVLEHRLYGVHWFEGSMEKPCGIIADILYGGRPNDHTDEYIEYLYNTKEEAAARVNKHIQEKIDELERQKIKVN